MGHYFNPAGSARAVLLWAVATRVQLGRWESVSADKNRQTMYGITLPRPSYWQGQYERHFCLIAARNLIGALGLLEPPLAVDQVLRDEITEIRGLNEHWKENMPVFMVRPRPGETPNKTGKSFAARNPAHTPYCWWAWNGKDGPLLTPNVPATAVHELIDRVEARVLSDHPYLADYIPPRSPSAWFYHHDGWLSVGPDGPYALDAAAEQDRAEQRARALTLWRDNYARHADLPDAERAEAALAELLDADVIAAT